MVARPCVMLAIVEPPRRAGIAGILERSGYDVEHVASSEDLDRIVNTGAVAAVVVCEHFGPPTAVEILNHPLGPVKAVVIADGVRLSDQALGSHPRVVSVVPNPYSLGRLRDAVKAAVEQRA